MQRDSPDEVLIANGDRIRFAARTPPLSANAGHLRAGEIQFMSYSLRLGIPSSYNLKS